MNSTASEILEAAPVGASLAAYAFITVKNDGMEIHVTHALPDEGPGSGPVKVGWLLAEEHHRFEVPVVGKLGWRPRRPSTRHGCCSSTRRA